MEPDTLLDDSRRLIRLERGVNLRDFGGYPTAGGRFVREGVLFRSGTMAYASEADQVRLRALRLTAVVDLRRGDERTLEPSNWHEDEVDYWCRDYEEGSGILKAGGGVSDASSAEAIAAMAQVYRDIPYDHAPSFRELFRKLGEGRVPLLVHCAAGKDRTGVAVALVLDALEVPRELIIEDYVMTNRHIDFGQLFEFRNRSEAFAQAMRKPSKPLFSAEPVYLEAMFAAVTERHGSVAAYLADVLDVTAEALARLRETLTRDAAADGRIDRSSDATAMALPSDR